MTRTHATFVSKEGNKNGEEEEEEKREGEAEEKGINSRKKKTLSNLSGYPTSIQTRLAFPILA